MRRASGPRRVSFGRGESGEGILLEEIFEGLLLLRCEHLGYFLSRPAQDALHPGLGILAHREQIVSSPSQNSMQLRTLAIVQGQGAAPAAFNLGLQTFRVNQNGSDNVACDHASGKHAAGKPSQENEQDDNPCLPAIHI